jgi:FKBP-type peptidyl-prolyl cis-trans isomerase
MSWLDQENEEEEIQVDLTKLPDKKKDEEKDNFKVVVEEKAKQKKKVVEEIWGVEEKPDLKITQEGRGVASQKGDKISLHTDLFLEESGKLIESSHNADEPLTFTIGEGEVIKCWDLGLIGLKKGSKVDLVCPPGLAYGDKGSNTIPPNAFLLFKI